MSIRVPKSGTLSVPKSGTPAVRYARTPLSVLHDVSLSFSARLIYAELALWVFQGRTVRRGVRVIAANLGMSKTTASKGLAELVAAGLIECSANAARGSRGMYSLPSNVFGQKQGKVDVVRSSPRGKRLVSVEKIA